MYCYRHPNLETGVLVLRVWAAGIVADCMVYAPGGIRCPEHAGRAQGAQRDDSGVRRRMPSRAQGALVTKI
jgi:hypothetical protein